MSSKCEECFNPIPEEYENAKGRLCDICVRRMWYARCPKCGVTIFLPEAGIKKLERKNPVLTVSCGTCGTDFRKGWTTGSTWLPRK